MVHPLQRSQRLHHSLPVLDVVSENRKEDLTRASTAKRKFIQRGDDSLTYIVSAFYAKILVIFGLAFPITDAIATKDYDTYDIFYVYLYIGSIAFLIYLYINKVTEGSFSVDCNSFDVENSTTIRYGSFYFRIGVTGFGIGSSIYSTFKFGQYFELSNNKDCSDTLKAIKPLLGVIFSLSQMLYIFSFNGFRIRKHKIIVRLGLMHMIATNLCEWLFVIVQETQRDLYKSALKSLENSKTDNISLYSNDLNFINSKQFLITKQIYEHRSHCLSSTIMEQILTNSQTYLAPCIVEYSLLCSLILGLIWRNTSYDYYRFENHERETKAKNKTVIKRQTQFSVDCTRAHKGLFTGILALAITIISLIMFFELVSHQKYKDIAVLQVNIWEAVLFWTGTVAAIFCLISLREVGFSAKRQNLELEHLLLLVTQAGVFMYFLFQTIGAILMGFRTGTGGIMRIITPISALLQSTWQTVLVLYARHRCCATKRQMSLKPGKQLVTFLLVTNISLWMVNRLKNNTAISHPNQMHVYGILAWNLITHVTMPLVVSYRFQASVCFYEIWKHVYKDKVDSIRDRSNRC